jgi:hypothetical protein
MGKDQRDAILFAVYQLYVNCALQDCLSFVTCTSGLPSIDCARGRIFNAGIDCFLFEAEIAWGLEPACQTKRLAHRIYRAQENIRHCWGPTKRIAEIWDHQFKLSRDRLSLSSKMKDKGTQWLSEQAFGLLKSLSALSNEGSRQYVREDYWICRRK